MQRAIPVGRSFREWWFVGLVVASASLLAAGLMLAVAQVEGAGVVLSLAAVSVFATVSGATMIVAGRCEVQPLGDRFLVRDSRGERAYSADQIICASLARQSNYSQGELKSTTRTFDLWVEGEHEPERIRMVNTVPLGTRDPLAGLIEQVLDHLHERANDALAARQPFEGEGWTLHPGELVVARGRATQAVRLDEMAAAEAFDDRLCIWKVGRDEPVLRIALSTANAHVLERVLGERIAPRPDGRAERDGTLGRVLFERRPPGALVATLWALPGLAVIVVLGTLTIAIARRSPEPALAGAIVALVLGGAWLACLLQVVLFRCHEWGVCRRWMMRERHLRYADVAAFTYSAVPQYVKGIYSGTAFALTFVARPGIEPPKLTYSRTLRHADRELEHLRDHISRIIAARMAAQFAAGHVVPWTEGLRFLAEGLEYRAAGFLGRKAPIVIPYDQIAGFDIRQRVFHVWVAGRKKPLVKESTTLPNFFPGYAFFEELLASRAASAEAVRPA